MSVFNDVIGISITSEYFNGSNEYKLFENKNDRVAMIFGRNGSGKSTIAQGFIETNHKRWNNVYFTKW